MGIEKKQRYCPTEQKMVLAERKRPNHLLHLVLTILTAGVWIVVWLFLVISADFRGFRCPSCGGETGSATLAKMTGKPIKN